MIYHMSTFINKEIKVYSNIKQKIKIICPVCQFLGTDNEDIKLINEEGACSDCLYDSEKIKILYAMKKQNT